jgi:hypothetical protein
MGKGSPDSARRLGLLAVVAALAGGIAVTGRRLAGRFGRGAEDAHTCACGTRYRVRGVGRHRVYWRDGEAVLGDRCVVCDARLPAGHDAVVV